MSNHLLTTVVAASAVFFPTGASAGFLDDVAKVVTAPITAPFEATKRLIEGDDPTRVITRPIESGGRVIEQTVKAAETVQQTVMSVPRDIIQNNLGDDWARVFDILTASQRVQFEMQMTAGRYLGACLQTGQCGIDRIAAMPLAAALRDAYKTYVQYSAPIDPQLAWYLSPVVPRHVLQGARFTVGSTPDMTVPGFLNAGHEVAGGGHAVTIANLVIFSRTPDFSTCSDFSWMLHELRHVEQYMRYSWNVLESIDGFAVDYMFNYGSLENDADAASGSWMSSLGAYYGFNC